MLEPEGIAWRPVVRGVIVGGLAVASFITLGATSPGPKQLQPTTAWRMDYGTERCSLAQQYADGAQTVFLQFDSYGQGDDFQATVAGKTIPGSSVVVDEGALRLPGDPAPREASLLHGKIAGGDPAISFPVRFVPYAEYERRLALAKAIEPDGRPARAYPDYEAGIGAFILALPGGSMLQFNVHSMAAPLAAMRTCLGELRKSWGLDPQVEKTLSRPAMLDRNDVIRLQSSYPASLLQGGLSAFVPVRIMVASDGTPTSCVIQLPVVAPEIRTAICGSLRHFQPALDAQGKPVASVYANAVRFVIPGTI